MNAFLKKEIRLLLPTSLAAAAFALPIFFVRPDVNSGIRSAFAVSSFFITPALVLMMTLSSFGSEIIGETFSNLLSQPISRRRIWRTKTVLLATATLFIFLIWWGSIFGNTNLFTPITHEWWARAIIIPFVLFSGGLWTVLLLRQVAAAFWFTLIVPAALMIPFLFLSQKYPDITEVGSIIVLSLYSIAGFIFARWLFIHAQDVQWTGGEITLPGVFSSMKRKSGSANAQTFRPRAALFAKEFQLHQLQFVMAGALFLLHLGVIATRNFGDFTPGTEFVLNTFWILWFAMPLVVGCAAVAEERKLGTLESQLCLPARSRTQYWIKFLFSMLLSLIFAVMVPLLLEGNKILPKFHVRFLEIISQYFLTKHNGLPAEAIAFACGIIQLSMPVLVLLGIAAVISAVSLYSSTLSRNTLQSLAPAVLGIAVAFTVLIGAGDVEKLFHYPLWRGWLIYLIGVPAMTFTFITLMKWNFKQVWISWRDARRNAIVFVATLAGVIVSTTAIYHRVWEYLMPIESPHGVARLEKTTAYKMESFGWRSTILLADGRAWSAWPSGDWKLKLKSGGFWIGSNWTSVASSYSDDAGIKEDGTLWVSEEPRKPSEFTKVKSPARPLVRVGDDQDWKSVSFNGRKAFLLKRDGTLWSWGENISDRKKEWPGLRAFPPERAGTNSDWTEITQLRNRTVLRKESGETWVVSAPISTKETNSIKLDDKTSLWRAEQWDGLTSVVGVSDQFGSVGNLQVGTDRDGDLFITGGWEFTRRDFELVKKRILLGKRSDWVSVAGEGETVVALKADGTLWKWKFADDPISNSESASAVRLGKYSDWIAIAEQFGGVTSLAADGSLWFWRSNDPRFSSASSEVIPPLLAASRRPLRIGNIFDAPGRSLTK